MSLSFLVSVSSPLFSRLRLLISMDVVRLKGSSKVLDFIDLAPKVEIEKDRVERLDRFALSS